MSSARPGVLDLANLGFEQGAHLLVKQALKSLQPGEELGVTGADRALVVHLEAWCRANGHRVRQALEHQVKQVMGYLKTYDQVFDQLTGDGNAVGFRDFLLKSPEMFMSLGEGAGTVSHVASFWRFRFPKGKPLTAPMGELLDLLQDFEAGLGAETHPLGYAA